MGDKKCAICSKLVKGTTDGITCKTCKQAHHLLCVNMIPTDVDYIKERGENWQCSSCLQKGRRLRSGSTTSSNNSSTDNVSISQEQINRIFLELASIGTMQQSLLKSQSELKTELLTRCSNLEKGLADCSAKLASHDELLAKQSDSIADIQTKVADIEVEIASVRTAGPPSAQRSQAAESVASEPDCTVIEGVASELLERQRRSRNLMIFGVPEIQGSTLTERKRSDQAFITGLFSFLNVDPTVASVTRIGKLQAAGGHRPLRVTLQSEAELRGVFKNVERLRGAADYRNVSLSYDRTPRQQIAYRNLKAQLRSRLDSGEQNLKIRYVNGMPKIAQVPLK